jgi:hypothetical protein
MRSPGFWMKVDEVDRGSGDCPWILNLSAVMDLERSFVSEVELLSYLLPLLSNTKNLMTEVCCFKFVSSNVEASAVTIGSNHFET